jgi:hypothetical protein
MGIFDALIRLAFPNEACELVLNIPEGPEDGRVGIHVIPYFGDEGREFIPELTEAAVRKAIRSLDWEDGFHQIVVIRAPGISMETGGSLDPEHGLAAAYRDNANDIVAVSRHAPESLAELEAIQFAFLKGGDAWRQVCAFD